MADFIVTMIGESGELEVYDIPGENKPPIDSWENAIRAARARLGFTGGGWREARISGPLGSYNVTIRMYDADEEIERQKIAARVKEVESDLKAEMLAHPETMITIGGDPDDPDDERRSIHTQPEGPQP